MFLPKPHSASHLQASNPHHTTPLYQGHHAEMLLTYGNQVSLLHIVLTIPKDPEDY